MQQHNVQLVRVSFDLLRPIAAKAAGLFYDRLFVVDPALRTLFRGNMTEQGARLMTMISAAIDLLDQPHRLGPILSTLGARHAGYGVVERHYDSVGEALLWTLEAGLAHRFTPDVRAAWTEVYGVIRQTMLAGAPSAVAQPLAA